MSPEELKACGRRLVEELFNQGDLSVADEFIAADYVEYVAGNGETVSGLGSVKEFVTELRAAFPDLWGQLEEQLVDGNNLVERVTATGTHTGQPFQGVPATGFQVKFSVWGIARMGQQGKFVERWTLVDRLALLSQLGVVPADTVQAGAAR